MSEPQKLSAEEALRLKAEGKIRNVELFYRRKNGESFPAQLSASLLTANNQQLTLAVIRDVSNYKQAENALRESEATYRNLINGMHESVWVIDFNGNFIDVNNSAIEMLRYSKEELQSLGIKGIETI